MKDFHYPDAWPFDFGAYIRKLRNDKGLTIAEAVARAKGKLTVSAVSVMERNLLPGTPSMRYLEGLSELYELPVLYLFALAYMSEKGVDPATVDKVWEQFDLEVFELGSRDPKKASVRLPRQQIESLGIPVEHLRFYSLRESGLLSYEATTQGFVLETDIIGVDSERVPLLGELVAGWWREEARLVVHRHELDKDEVVIPAQREQEPYSTLEKVSILEYLGTVVWRSGAVPKRGR